MRVPNIQSAPVVIVRQDKETIDPLTKSTKDSGEPKDVNNELASRVQEQMEDFTEEVALEANEVTDILKKGLLLKLHKDTDRYFVQVINMETQEVLQELPPKEFLDLVAKIRNLVGVFLDESV